MLKNFTITNATVLLLGSGCCHQSVNQATALELMSAEVHFGLGHEFKHATNFRQRDVNEVQHYQSCLSDAIYHMVIYNGNYTIFFVIQS